MMAGETLKQALRGFLKRPCFGVFEKASLV